MPRDIIVLCFKKNDTSSGGNGQGVVGFERQTWKMNS